MITVIHCKLGQTGNDIHIVMQLAQLARLQLTGPTAIEQYGHFHALLTRHDTHHHFITARSRFPVNTLQRVALLIFTVNKKFHATLNWLARNTRAGKPLTHSA